MSYPIEKFNKLNKLDKLDQINRLDPKEKEEILNEYLNKYFINEQKWQLVNDINKRTNAKIGEEFDYERISKSINQLIKIEFDCFFKFNNYQGDFVLQYQSDKQHQDQLEYINNFLTCYKTTKAMITGAKIFNDIDPYYNLFVVMSEEDLYGICFIYNPHDSLVDSDINMLEVIFENVSMFIKNSYYYKKALNSNEAKTQFLATMSHEIKTPLNSILGFSNFLNNTDLNDKSKVNSYVKQIINSTNYLTQILDDILNFSKIDLNKIQLDIEKVDSKKIVIDAISMFENNLNIKNIEIKLFLISTPIEVDPKRFKQVISNLINNAIKYTPNYGHITITTYLEDHYFCFEIEDNGEGIDSSEKDKIFELFYRTRESNKGKSKGSGIGLALAKKIIELHKGKIGYESEINVGSIFWIKLPLNRIY